jgi:hypothetical protein
MVPVAIHEYAFDSAFPFLDRLTSAEMQAYSHIFREDGYLYSVFGGMIEGIPNLDRYKIVLIARDPRDILVSHYFSTAFSHPVPLGNKRADFMAKRTVARESTIDEFVLSESESLCNQFARYKSLLLARYPHVHLATYEHMVTEFENWLSTILRYCALEVSSDLFRSLCIENQRARPKIEDIKRHVRKGQPGDYKNKLKPETIAQLNAKFEPILADFQYTA